jgi:hypothetical protein
VLKPRSFPPNGAPKMRERHQLFFGLRLVSKEFQHPAIQTKMEHNFHKIKVRSALGIYGIKINVMYDFAGKLNILMCTVIPDRKHGIRNQCPQTVPLKLQINIDHAKSHLQGNFHIYNFYVKKCLHLSNRQRPS